MRGIYHRLQKKGSAKKTPMRFEPLPFDCCITTLPLRHPSLQQVMRWNAFVFYFSIDLKKKLNFKHSMQAIPRLGVPPSAQSLRMALNGTDRGSSTRAHARAF